MNVIAWTSMTDSKYAIIDFQVDGRVDIYPQTILVGNIAYLNKNPHYLHSMVVATHLVIY